MTRTEQLVANTLKDLEKYHGLSWSDMSDSQKSEKLAARLFFIVSQNSRAEAKSGDPLGEFIHELHAALVKVTN